MDLSSMWLPEMDVEDTGFMNLCDKTPTIFQEQAEMNLESNEKATSIKSSETTKPLASTTPSSNTFTLSFGDRKPKDDILPFDDSLGYEVFGTGKVPAIARTTVQLNDHVLAERKRREKLNHHFISLSTILPNLKKMDKASILEDATNYIKHLEERMKELEGSSSVQGNDVKESIIAMTRSRLSDKDDDDLASNEMKVVDGCKSLPEIEVRMSGSSVLVRIQSPENSSLLVNAINTMQVLGLSIASSSAILFANTTTLITIVGQIEDDFFMTATDLLKTLQHILYEL